MLITRTSTLTGNTHTMDLPITQEQIDARHGGTLVQNAFPHLSAGEREFIMTGITESEWDAAFGPDDGDDGYDDSSEDYEDDGQPTEMEEWRDFDPDC